MIFCLTVDATACYRKLRTKEKYLVIFGVNNFFKVIKGDIMANALTFRTLILKHIMNGI